MKITLHIAVFVYSENVVLADNPVCGAVTFASSAFALYLLLK